MAETGNTGCKHADAAATKGESSSLLNERPDDSLVSLQSLSVEC